MNRRSFLKSLVGCVAAAVFPMPLFAKPGNEAGLIWRRMERTKPRYKYIIDVGRIENEADLKRCLEGFRRSRKQ